MVWGLQRELVRGKTSSTTVWHCRYHFASCAERFARCYMNFNCAAECFSLLLHAGVPRSEFCDRFVGAFRESPAARLLLNAVFGTVFLSLSAPSSLEVFRSALGFPTGLWTSSARSDMRDRVLFVLSPPIYEVSCLDVVVDEMLLSFVSIFTQFALVCG